MGKIIYFPPTYPDEDFRSILHRYYLRSAKTFTKCKMELLGGNSPKKVVYPINLTQIALELGVSEDFTDKIIENHTFFPVVKIFLTKIQQENLLQGMKIYSLRKKLLNKKFNSQISKVERYCPECMLGDFTQYQIVYLHRMHQFVFLSHCLKHGGELISVCTHCGERLVQKDGKEMLISLNCNYCNHYIPIDRDVRVENIDQGIRDDIETIMNEKETGINLLYYKFMMCLGARNYIDFRGEFNSDKDIISNLTEFYGENCLSKFGLSEEKLIREFREKRLFNKSHMGNFIVIYILLMRFFSGSVQSFLSQTEIYSNKIPFGTGPWQCFNPVCTYYNKPVITSIKRQVHELVTGKFKCSYCGCIYIKKMKFNEMETSEYVIETWGSLFVQKVIEYWDKGLNYTEISEELGIKKSILYKYMRPFVDLKRNALLDNEKDVRLEVAYAEANLEKADKAEKYKEVVMETIGALGPGTTRSQISVYTQTQFSWLMKYESDWMEMHLPSKEASAKEINTEILDSEIYVELERAIVTIYNANPVRWIARDSILELLPRIRRIQYNRNLSLLPRSRALLESNIETDEMYKVRNSHMR
ncbi:TnsD family transposase [Paenibacillus sp. LS1]|uniref:TnsD family transposase n=1 Tax=Paenibacillus sp. LS1 TaxID=2992120 RepID=UPI0022318A2C|nr:TnsD family transposase [Paenibacillus sp. LS1]MCW3794429.1 TnsD family transposase [Paenibacillus sp. LS1]